MSLQGRLYGANKGLVKRCFDSPHAAGVLIPEVHSHAVTVLAGPADPTSITGITACSGTFQGPSCYLWPSLPASQHLVLRRFLFKHVGAGVKRKAGFQGQSVPLSDRPLFFFNLKKQTHWVHCNREGVSRASCVSCLVRCVQSQKETWEFCRCQGPPRHPLSSSRYHPCHRLTCIVEPEPISVTGLFPVTII